MTRCLLRLTAISALTSLAVVVQPQPPGAQYYNPRFSSDGTRVIFESTRDGKMAVYTVNTDGSGLRRATDGLQNDAQPQWSSDGALMTFTSDAPGVNKVFVMAANGGERRQISAGPKHDAAPSFSKDGKFVAWAATTELAVNWRDIGVAATDGSGGPRYITSGPGNDQAPAWISPTRLVFVREFPPKTDWRSLTPEDHAVRRASSELFAINADGTGLVNLTNNAFSDSAPSWAASAKRIFFSSDRSGTNAFYSMDENGGDVRRVGDVGGAVSNDGQKITFAKVVGGRSGVFVRDLATGSERELAGGDKPQE